MEHIGDRQSCGKVLTGLRKATGKSSRHVAQEAGVNPASLLQWEKGIHMPTLPKLCLVLRFYGETATIGWDPGPGPEVQS